MGLTINKKMATIREAAPILGISEYSLRLGIKQGLYPFNRVGKKYLIDLAHMEKHLEQQAIRNMDNNKPKDENKDFSFGYGRKIN